MNSGIEVFFTQLNRPWNPAFANPIAPTPTVPVPYQVNVYGPSGRIFRGSAPNGYLSIDLPPGTYMVTGNARGAFYQNYDSNETLVTVCCGRRACVTIIPRDVHSCIWWLVTAFELIARAPKTAPAIAGAAKELIAPLKKIAELVPAENRLLDFRLEESKALLDDRK